MVTCGPSVGRPQDIPCDPDASLLEIMGRMSPAQSADLFIWAESILPFLPHDVEKSPIPTVFYTSCPYLGRKHLPRLASLFDFAFVSGKYDLEPYQEAGCRHVEWLQCGCDPEIHREFDLPRTYDVCFLGTAEAHLYPDRRVYLERLLQLERRQGLRIFLANGYYGEEMAKAYSASRIVFNKTFDNLDLNARVYEAMSCGRLLLNDPCPGGGLNEVFQSGEHYAGYGEDNFEDLIIHFLTNPEERERIARKGQEEVRKKHTYLHRVRRVIEVVEKSGMLGRDCSKERRTRPPADQSTIYGCAYYAIGLYGPAMQCLLSRVRAEEPAAIDWNHLGICLASADHPDKSMDCFAQAKEIDSELVAAGSNAARISFDSGEESHSVEESLAVLDRLDAGEWTKETGLFFPNAWTWDKAELLKAANGRGREGEIDPVQLQERIFRARAHELVGLVHFRAGRYEEALRHWESIRELFPRRDIVETSAGRVLIRLGRLDEARERFARARSLGGLNLDAALGLGEIAFLRGDFRKAASEYRCAVEIFRTLRALQQDPELDRVTLALNRLGECWEKLGDLHEACHWYEVSLEENSNQPEIRARIEQCRSTSAKRSDAAAKPVSVIIPLHNGVDHTRLCIDSLREFTRIPFQLVCVDNGSTDGTPPYLKSLGDILAISNPRNLGFAAACNQGLETAEGDYIVLLNNDVIVTENWLSRLIAHAERESTAGVVVPYSNHSKGEQLIPDVPYRAIEEMHQFAGRLAEKNRDSRREIANFAGFCVLIKRKVIERIGGFDTRFGIGNYEDDDFGLRVRRAGFKILLAEDVFIHHFGRATFSRLDLDYKDQLDRNRRLFEEKWQVSLETAVVKDPNGQESRKPEAPRPT